MTLSFSSIAPITPLTTHTYTTPLKSSWSIGSVPNGGYITSLFLLIARQHMTLHHRSRHQPHAITLHLEFLRRTSASDNDDNNMPATFTVRDIKLGSRISNLHITLSQPQPPSGPEKESRWRDNVEGYVTMSNLTTETGLTLPIPFALYPAPPPPPADFARLLERGQDGNWMLHPPTSFPRFRKAAQHIRIYLPTPRSDVHPEGNTAKAYLDQWVRFHPEGDGGKWTNDALGFVVDMFPQIVEEFLHTQDQDRDRDRAERSTSTAPAPTPTPTSEQPKRPQARFWYPTLALNLEVKKSLPEQGVEWLFVRVSAKVIRNGRMDLEVSVLDRSGEVVALSTHVGLIMGTERNMAGRGGGGASKI